MADVGFIALTLALTASIYSAIAFIFGAGKGYERLAATARIGFLAACGLVFLAAYALYYSLLNHNFQLEYVASHISRDMSLIYKISAFWAGNAGSLLLMTCFLSLIAAVWLIQRREGDNGKFSAYASAVIVSVLAFFLLLLILVANPFEKLPYAPVDGSGLNPILKNPGMIFHPPLLLAGYITFTIPFALAVAALITKSQYINWLSKTRTWALLAWLLLGAGNIVGAWWAYVELGWGGYWAWDPVENAGLMPWLIGTAFLHTINMQKRTGTLKVWTMVFIILTFNLCMFGTFLTRSGFLSSVHTFTNTGMEPLFLAFLTITLIGPLGLVLIRRRSLRSEKREVDLISKENSFVVTNILFIAATFVIFLGTMFPWLSEKIAGSITTLESSFFDKAVGPLFLLIILLVGICILIGWRHTSITNLFRRILFPLVLSLVLCLALYLFQIKEWYALTLFPLCCFAILTHLFSLFRRVRARSLVGKMNPIKALAGLLWANRPHYGGMIVHLGIVLIAIGVIGSSFYQSEVEAGLKPGESISIENYTLTYDEMTMSEDSTKIIFTASLSVHDGDNIVGILKPEKYIQLGSGRVASEVDIRSMPHWWIPLEDLYVVLASWTTDGTTTFEILVNPLVSLIWAGGGVLALGGIFAFWPSRAKKSVSKNTHKRDETETSTDLPPDPRSESGSNESSEKDNIN
ncbi:heme lyase CcmF/NrfE family subunit [Chloroflexota bacterium]